MQLENINQTNSKI